MGEVTHGPVRSPLPLRAYNSVWQLRIDTWSALADLTKRLFDATVAEDQRGALEREIDELIQLIDPVEQYWAFPGPWRFRELQARLIAGDHEAASEDVDAITRGLAGDPSRTSRCPSFEVLVVDDLTPPETEAMREELRGLRRPDDGYSYELVVVPSFEDALIAVLLNFNLQACVIRPGFQLASRFDLGTLRHFCQGIEESGVDRLSLIDRVQLLGERVAALRPELDLYLVGHASIEAIAGRLGRNFRRVFLRQDALELHLSILRGVEERSQTPFFTILREYSRRPTGVFHALPISRGKSVVNSPWIRDMGEFYGLNMFLAETSATSGGLDSLLDPTGPIKKAQELAARAFGAEHSFFVTNGTSTANKIVVQSIVAPGDIVLVDRNCHKSHHYALMLAGAQVAYLDSYPLDAYSIYGAVPLNMIKRLLLAYRRDGRLDQVKMISLTNCTFDGIVYDVGRVMEECLAIKPDLVFLWDEAWFAFAGFHPTYRRRTAMATAARLRQRFRDPAYQQRYAAQAAELAHADDDTLITTPLLADPARVRLRVYATQSTHKTLTALRQGSMIHVFDQDFSRRNEEAFHEAYMTHTSTSPNYQILASLDVGRRQVQFEGFELVQKQIELAMILRDAVETHPLLHKYFRFLTSNDLIPSDYRSSGIDRPLRAGLAQMDQAWQRDEFVLDPSRLTLSIGPTGIDGDTFKHEHLMDRYGIQVNKTSRNTVLFMTNIGTTRSSVAYLIEVLVKLAQEIEAEIERMGRMERRAHERRVASLTLEPPPLPDFSAFHARFRSHPRAGTPEGNLREAFFLAYDDASCEYLTQAEVTARVGQGHEVVSAMFVTPYPPGFPILVPGQVVSAGILAFMQALDTREIHGYWPEVGYRVFTDAALASREVPAPTSHDDTAEPESGDDSGDPRAASGQTAAGAR